MGLSPSKNHMELTFPGMIEERHRAERILEPERQSEDSPTGGFFTRDKSVSAQDFEVYFIVGLALLGLGIMPLASGLYGYNVTLPEIERAQDSINEKAEEQGLSEIPGVSIDENLAQFFTIMILVGGSMVIIGLALLSIALLRRRESVEEAP